MTNYRVHLRYTEPGGPRMNFTAYVDAETRDDAAVQAVHKLRAERGVAKTTVVTAEPVTHTHQWCTAETLMVDENDFRITWVCEACGTQAAVHVDGKGDFRDEQEPGSAELIASMTVGKESS